jgi:hypothetical protein
MRYTVVARAGNLWRLLERLRQREGAGTNGAKRYIV